ncbi:MAG: ATP-binding protein [Pseudomonadota bacterium]
MKRDLYLKKIDKNFAVNPAVALLGPRQCGKTTLAEMYEKTLKGKTAVTRFDLENPRDLIRLQDPMLALENLDGLIIIDEVQRRPDLFPVLRVLIDQHRPGRQFLILGSASRDLIRQSSETLAGRISYLELTPFSYEETHNIQTLLLRGGFPRSYLAPSDQQSFRWLRNYITNFLERDLPSFGINVAPEMMRRFWMMICHYHGNLVNFSDLGRSLGVSHITIRNYLDILSSTFMIRQLNPWFANINKRQVKSPKIYFKDSGIFHQLLGVRSFEDLTRHPKLGASWEGFALEQIVRHYDADPEDCYFWAVHSQAELDLLIIKDGKKLGFEFKYTDAPKITKSLNTAWELLELDALTVIYPGPADYPLTTDIHVQALESLLSQ